ncbi:biotin--[acetyl-CoA-carboxylase] ligase [Nocardiopsis terrae]|uniref:biotin--[biotin carboxyl-carrier protein] ligase n=1 Tax=Nocardiopsis terrae TaxID=372655 RepID=A0ABR9HBN0_9ACTN|nr:biotin--[acetyl-CoA-carboxylase] ligase [Nocardiopsis terrae]MBE1456427.1 BirA family biotin operon repressor/biotin-[acetyl-CoA-carboxylase] ligase [Nocardiopsis terrae]GHC76899.1 biotin--[acetyl-CoA-carboxylase] ligase [Nocardiopsis terrae]
MTGEHSSEIPPLDRAAITAAAVRPGGLWRSVEVVPEAGSTNTDLIARSKEGAPEGTVLATEHQTAGKGRLGRGFTTPPRVALTFSVLVRPVVPPDSLGWLSPMMGAAAVAAVRRLAGVGAVLKWPNDVLVPGEGGEGKLAGILAEADFSDPARLGVVVGMGLNVAQERGELPVRTATSLRAEGASGTGRGALLAAVLAGFEERYTAWTGTGGDAGTSGLAAEYRDVCVTVGRGVRVHLPGDRLLEGTATGVDDQARLLVAGPGGEQALSAGDVVHVRPGD